MGQLREPNRLLKYDMYRRRLAALRAGRHPVTGKRLEAASRSCIGLLQHDEGEQVQRPGQTAVRSYAFLSARRPPAELAFEAWLANFVKLVPDAAHTPRKKDEQELE